MFKFILRSELSKLTVVLLIVTLLTTLVYIGFEIFNTTKDAYVIDQSIIEPISATYNMELVEKFWANKDLIKISYD